MFKNILEKLYLKQEGNLVYYDSMTNAKTRLYYDTIAKKKYSYENCGVLYVDIDNLKKINDTQGHKIGDNIIKLKARQLMNTKGIVDVCRVGGDEFVCFTTLPFDFSKVDNITDISYGFDYRDICQNIDDVIANAEKAMYKVKQQKKKLGIGRQD